MAFAIFMAFICVGFYLMYRMVQAEPNEATRNPSFKSRSTAGLLALFLGGFGMHKFYLGQTVMGFVYLLFCWTFIPAVVSFFECIIILSTSHDDFDLKFNKKEMALDATISQSALKHAESATEALTSLATLLEKGLLTREEFDAKKTELLKKIA